MKRLLPAFICALALHVIILSSDFSWLKLAPGRAPASRSLSITLSADTNQKHKGPAAVSKKQPENRFQPDLQPKPVEKPDPPIPAAARLENSAQNQKPAPAQTPKKRRQKQNLKALTRAIAPVRATKAVRAASIDKDDTFSAVHAKAVSPVSPAIPPGQDLAAERALIKKANRMAGQRTQSMTYSAAPAGRPGDNSASATALTLARPLYRQNPAPTYPHRARRMGYEGIVMLKVLVDENGRVDDLTVLESSGYPILDRTALASVRKWLFEPGTEGGIKKKMWVRIPVRFDLK